MKAEGFYRVLLRVYPKGFREEYGEAMAQHFSDLWRDACGNGRAFGRLVFWGRICADTFLSAVRARFSEKRKGSTGLRELKIMKVPSFRFLFLAFLLPLLAGVAMIVWLQ